MSFRNERNKRLSENVIKNFEKRNMEAYYVDTKDEAVKKVLDLIKENSSVSWGGCQTAIDLGLFDVLKKGNYNILDREATSSKEEAREVILEAMNADYYIMSANAISANGTLINIDGLGNRVAALVYGPKNIIVIAGVNKIEPDEETALKRARNVASPINNIRFSNVTPCTVDGLCHDCTSKTCICANIVTTRFSAIPQRIKVILVGEELGF